MLTVFVNVVLPVFLVAGLGCLVQLRLRPSIQALNQTALYIMFPCLIFTSLMAVDLRSEVPIRLLAFTFLLTGAMLLAALVISRLARLDRRTTSALMLTVAFPNLGNYGLPVVTLAFGESGLAVALLVISLQSLYSSTLTTLIASSSNASLRGAVGHVLRLPTIYAVVSAMIGNVGNIQLPHFLVTALEIPARAAIPLMVIVLGMQLAGTRKVEVPRLVGLATFTRLLVSPVVAVALALALGLSGVARDVVIVGSAMPTAVATIVMATQFDARPRLVSDVVIASTLASVISVTVVLSLLTGKVSLF